MPRHRTEVEGGYHLDFESNCALEEIIPRITTIHLTFKREAEDGSNRINFVTFDVDETTEKSTPILLSNEELDFLKAMLPNLRTSLLEALLSDRQNAEDQTNLDWTISAMQGALDPHAKAVKDVCCDKQLEVENLFAVLSIGDEQEAYGRMERMMDSLKL